MKSVDNSKIMYRSDKLMGAASNRYRMVVQVANRAKHQYFDESDSHYAISDLKPVCQAIIEMADEINEVDPIAKRDITQRNTKKISVSSSAQHSNSSSLISSKPATLSQPSTKSNLQFLKNRANPQAWDTMLGWINSSICQINLEAARFSAERLIDKHSSKTPRQLAEIIFLHKSAQVAGVDLVRTIPHSEQIIRVLSGWDLPSVAKLCTEMVFQIAYIYGSEKTLEDQKLQITSIFALASLNERAIDAKVSWLKFTGDPLMILKGTALSALSKAFMICSVANSACIFFEHQSLVAAGQTDILLSKAGNLLFGVNSNNALENKLDLKLEQAKELATSA